MSVYILEASLERLYRTFPSTHFYLPGCPVATVLSNPVKWKNPALGACGQTFRLVGLIPQEGSYPMLSCRHFKLDHVNG